MRLFISIPPSGELVSIAKKENRTLQEKFGKFKLRFQPEEKWHFTLLFLGKQPEENAEKIKLVLKDFKILKLNIKIKSLTYGPPKRTPRMIWVTTLKETSQKIDKIKKELESNLIKREVDWRKDKRPFHGHLTLAKFPPTPKKHLPQIEKEIRYSYQIPSIDLMQSFLSPRGSTYKELYSKTIS